MKVKIFENESTNAGSTIQQAAITIAELGSGLDVIEKIQELSESYSRIKNGDISDIEELLITQAKTLDFFFYETISKIQGLELINQIQFFVEIALRAQDQSRKTLLALSSIKCPNRSTFIKQQNNAVNQQINN